MSASDVIVIICVMFALMLSIFVTYFAVDTLRSELMSVSAINETISFGTAMNGVSTVLNKLDYFGLGVFIAFILGLMVTAWLVGSHPIFVIAFIIVDVITVLIATIFNYVWDETTSMSVFGSTINHFPIMNHIITNLPVYSAIIGILGLVVMYAKPRRV